ncbi:MAG: MFS transporter [Hyphomicrobiales bacterium]|nr:MFS transporter [Hyphomicrobiales bacterium]
MPGRWKVLALLFAVRTAMALQFQSVAALAPLLRHDLDVDIADIGFLIGLYLSPGIALALPGGAIGKRFGDKLVVVAGLALMTTGGLVMTFSHAWAPELAGRLLAGIGGVLLNVLMSKMVTDWFAGKEIATAMAIFVNSWPIGIALALLVLPPIAASGGVAAAFLFTSLLVALGLFAMAGLYRAPPPQQAAAPAAVTKADFPTLLAVTAAGLIWGLYNGAIAMIFSFGPSMLAERGWSVQAAGSVTSVTLWLVGLSVPLGGFLADRTGRFRLVLVGGLLVSAAMLLVAARVDTAVPAFAVLGLVCGLSAGPIMSLPSRVLLPETRAVGMGVFFTLFYVIAVVAPVLGGQAANVAGSVRVTFDLGALMLVSCCPVLWLFELLASGSLAAKRVPHIPRSKAAS